MLRFKSILFAAVALLLGMVVLAGCGPSAPAERTLAQADQPTESPDATTPPVTPHPDDPERPASGIGSGTPQPPQPPKPTRATPYFQEPPTKPPLPESPEPTYAPPPAHPQGLDGCRMHGVFGPSTDKEGDAEFVEWCADQTTLAIEEACNGLGTVEEQLACGTEFMSSYISLLFREGPHRCFAIDRERWRQERQTCLEGLGEHMDAAVAEFHDIWGRLRAGGDAATDVVEAKENVLDCLSERGYGRVAPDILFIWQKYEHPLDYIARTEAQTDAEKALEERLFTPSVECGMEHGLFEAQEEAWTAELERLAQEEPEVAAPLVSEGVLDALNRPGLPGFLTGDPSSW